MRWILLLPALLFGVPNDVSVGYEYLDLLRVHAEAPRLKRDAALQRAAEAHTRYLLAHDAIGHKERPRPYFSGADPFVRAVAAGRASRLALENISYGDEDFFDSLETLFAAPYHRLAFLHPYYDSVGIAWGESDEHRWRRVYTYVLGNSHVERLCRHADMPTSGAVYTNICADGKKISAAAYEAALRQSALEYGEVIVWPPAGARDIPPAFFEELPDPMPKCSVSGYVLSVTFNPAKIGRARVIDFVLKDSVGREVAAKRLDAGNDPNGKLRPFEHLLIPLKRLRYGATYHAQLRFEADGRTRRLDWSFTTAKPPFRLIEPRKKDLSLRPGYYSLYFAPRHCNDRIKRYSIRCKKLRARLRRHDANTINIHLPAPGRCELRTDRGVYRIRVLP